MLRRAKSFFVKRKKNAERDVLPADLLTDKSHLARKPIVVDSDRRLISFREPPDRPELNAMVRSSTSLRDIGDRVDLRPINFRRVARPKTEDLRQQGGVRRLSFPPPQKEDKTEDLKGRSGGEIVSGRTDSRNRENT